ncbi:MAG: hypothetical protein R2880_03955 [Deinococcales bacterium]
MEILPTAQRLSNFLMPLLPTLIMLKDEAVKEMGKDLPETAQNLWNILLGKAKDNAKLIKVAKQQVEDPDDEDYRAKFHKTVLQELEQNPTLAGELAKLMEAANIAQTMTLTEVEGKDVTQKSSRALNQNLTVTKGKLGNITQEQ